MPAGGDTLPLVATAHLGEPPLIPNVCRSSPWHVVVGRLRTLAARCKSAKLCGGEGGQGLIIRVLLRLVLLGGTGWAIWEGVRPGAKSRGERLKRIGVALTAIGIIWTIFAWWLVVPELILVAGLILLLLSRRAGAVA